MNELISFHPAVRKWFESHFTAPTEPQALGWPEIQRGRNVLISAPTGSGKTLAAFLASIDRLLHRAENGSLMDQVYIVYVSPLKALSNDIQRNLEIPLKEIHEIAQGDPAGRPYRGISIRTLVRTGDTPSSARQAMVRRPPHILITTPESLYLMITAEKSRQMFRNVETVIVDEIHAVFRDKRGSHLALTLARLDEIVGAYGNTPLQKRPVRIGLSATQRPLEEIARFLVGEEQIKEDGSPDCVILDLGHERNLDLAVEVPPVDLQAVASNELWGDIYDRLKILIQEHRTTLIFVNTRRLAERVAFHLMERLETPSPGKVFAHHGSLSKEKRLKLEERLKKGELKALVATSSLELGIDIGTIDLVCQIQSPRSIATFLQRIGRSGHALGLKPKGRLFPTTRDELIECAALIRSVRRGRLDRVHPPVTPLDILAQQIVATCSGETWKENDLYEMVKRATPYASLYQRDFDQVIEMLSEGFATRRGRRSAYLHRDRIHRTLRGRRGARISALTSGGAIPDVADYRVVTEPEGTFIGTVNEEFAVESLAGDIFLLGTHSWRIRRIEAGTVIVEDARGAPPNVPFWHGEAPSRTDELSEEVSQFRLEVANRLQNPEGAKNRLMTEAGLDSSGADQILKYISATQGALGVIPSQEDIVFERFFDDTGGMQIVIHAPFGARINRAFCLALRKRFCQIFDFELQAAASDNAFLLSLGPQHSFPLEDVFRFLNSETVEDVLIQALLPSPMFITRWRWNANRSLAVLRQKGGKRVPPPLQRIQAEDLLTAVFPAQVAYQENVTYPIEIPDHPLVRQTILDCLHEAMDLPGLKSLLQRIEKGEVRLHSRDTIEPSPISHEILSGMPFTFLDDAPLEERRARTLSLRRTLPEDVRDLGVLDPEAIERVKEEVWPHPRDAEEVQDAILGLGVVRFEHVKAWENWISELVRSERAAYGITPKGDRYLFALEKLPLVRVLYPHFKISPPDVRLPEDLNIEPPDREHGIVEILRGFMEYLGPITVPELSIRVGLGPDEVSKGLLQLESEGFLLRGRFRDPNVPLAKGDLPPHSLSLKKGELEGVEFCDRRLLARIHRYTLDRLRREIEPVSGQDLMRFLFEWQHLTSGSQLFGKEGVYQAIAQLQGFEIPVSVWEKEILSIRISEYQSHWLDSLCFSGDVVWGRLSQRDGSTEPLWNKSSLPSRATPITIALREDISWLIESIRNGKSPEEPPPGVSSEILDLLRRRGALFFRDLISETGRLPSEVEYGLWDLVSRGLVTGDGFQAVRSLILSKKWKNRLRRDGLARGRMRILIGEGRWALLLGNPPTVPPLLKGETGGFDLMEKVAQQLLKRYGILFRDIVQRESFAVPWREILRALRREEARGTVRGGRFVAGFTGEQYALPEAVDGLRRVRREEKKGEVIRISAVDPLNLVGIVTPSSRVPAIRNNLIFYRDGIPVASLEGGKIVVRAEGGEKAVQEFRTRNRR